MIVESGTFAEPVGYSKLDATVARLCKSAGIIGYITNHSLCATIATRLYQAGVYSDGANLASEFGWRAELQKNIDSSARVVVKYFEWHKIPIVGSCDQATCAKG